MLFLKYFVFFFTAFLQHSHTSAKSDTICHNNNIQNQNKKNTQTQFIQQNKKKSIHKSLPWLELCRTNWRLELVLMLVKINERWKNCTFSKINCSLPNKIGKKKYRKNSTPYADTWVSLFHFCYR